MNERDPFLQDLASMFDTDTEQFIVGDERRFTGFLEEQFAQIDEVESAGQSGFEEGLAVAAGQGEAPSELSGAGSLLDPLRDIGSAITGFLTRNRADDQALFDVGEGLRGAITPLIDPETARAVGEAIPLVDPVTGPLFEAAAKTTSPAEVAGTLALGGIGPTLIPRLAGSTARGAGTARALLTPLQILGREPGVGRATAAEALVGVGASLGQQEIAPRLPDQPGPLEDIEGALIGGLGTAALPSAARAGGRAALSAVDEAAFRLQGRPRAFAAEGGQINRRVEPGFLDPRDVTPEELSQAIDNAGRSEHDQIVRALGSEEAAVRFERLDRLANSSPMSGDFTRVDAAADELARITDSFTPEQERLIFGRVDDPEIPEESLRDLMNRALSITPEDGIPELTRVLTRGLSRLTPERVAAVSAATRAQVAGPLLEDTINMVRVREAVKALRELGQTDDQIFGGAIQRLRSEGIEDADIDVLLGPFIRGQTQATPPVAAIESSRPTAQQAITGARDPDFASRPPRPVPDGRAGGSGPPSQRNRLTADAGLPEDQRTAVFRPAPTIPIADDPLVRRIARAIRETEPATQESLQALSRGRARQIGRAGAGARTAQTFGEVGPAATARMGGQIARPEFEPIAQLFTPEEVETLLSRIWGRGSVLEFANAQPGQINFRQLNADRAFKKLFNSDSATLPTPSELELLERVFGPEFVRAVLSKKRLGQRAWDSFLDIWNLPRSLLATGDISATIRQAGVLGPGNPIEFKNAFRNQIKAFASEPYALASREAIEADPDFLRFTTKSGTPQGVGQRADRRLHISAIGAAADRSRREEQFMTSLAGRLPIVRNSERAFVTMLNELRFKVMKKMVQHTELANGGPATDVQLDRIADFINYATGRGSLGKAEAAAPLLNGLGFSPRLAISRFQLALPIFTRAPNVRKKFAQDLVTYAGTGAMIMFLLDQNVPGVDVIRDPRSSDFGKVKLGKTRLDLFAGNLQTARFVFGLASGERQSAGTRSVAGQNRFDTVARFLRTKAHPSLGLVLDVASEEDFLGEEFSLDPERFTEADLRRNPALRTFTPLLIQDIIEAWKESGPLEAAVAGVGSLLGAGAITFATADDASQELWGQPITEVWPFQQGLAKDLHARTSDRGPSAFDQSDINHYAAFQDILQQLRDGTIDKRIAVNRYFSINTFYSGLRQGLSAGIFGGDLTEEPVFPVTPSGGTPEQQAALQEYFDSQTPFETPSGFDSEAWRKELRKLETKWGADATVLQYVLANTHTRPIPVELLNLLPENTRKDVKRSSDARAAHLTAEDIEVPESITAPAAPLTAQQRIQQGATPRQTVSQETRSRIAELTAPQR